MGQIFKDALSHNTALYILSALAVIMLFTGMFLPPLGVIPNSVLIGVGEIFGFGTLISFVKGIDMNRHATFKKGDVEISVVEDKERV